MRSYLRPSRIPEAFEKPRESASVSSGSYRQIRHIGSPDFDWRADERVSPDIGRFYAPQDTVYRHLLWNTTIVHEIEQH